MSSHGCGRREGGREGGRGQREIDIWREEEGERERERERCTLSPDLLDQGSTLMASFNLNYLWKGPLYKYSHIGSWAFNILIVEEHKQLLG